MIIESILEDFSVHNISSIVLDHEKAFKFYEVYRDVLSPGKS